MNVVAERIYVDIEDHPDLIAVAKEASGSGKHVILREAVHQFAVISPIGDETGDETSELTNQERQERVDRILALAGSMKGLLDEDFLEENYKQRSYRPSDEDHER